MAEKKSRTKQLVLLALLIGFAIFTSFVYTAGTEAQLDAVTISDAGQKGKLIYQKYNCTSCHQLYGLGGYIGPDLTNVSSKGDAYVRAFLQNGSAVMPDYDLPAAEIDALVAFLSYANETGHFPERNAKLTWYGSINISGNGP